MSPTSGLDVTELRSAVAGPLSLPGDDGYDDARRVWNAAIDTRPAVVVGCTATDDVVAAVRFARQHSLEIAVRGGAHSSSGFSTCDGGLVVDLSRLNRVTVDPQARRARVQGGALIRDLDAATSPHGLAVPMGMVGHTGVGGLTLGGGLGWLTRRGGLALDNLLSAEVVVADGRVLRAADDEHADLFWALRGGGGNFGVVTEFEFRLLEAGPVVQFALLFFEAAHGRESLRLMRSLVEDLPASVSLLPAIALTAPPAPFVPVEHQGKTGNALLLTGFGDPAGHARIVERVRAELPPLFELVTPMPFAALQQLLDEANAWGLYSYESSGYFAELTDEMIELLLDHGSRKTSPMSVAFFYRLDGAFCDVAEDATAFGGRRAPQWAAFLSGVTPDPAGFAAERAWVCSLRDALRPYAVSAGAYVNAGGQRPDQVQATYGRKFPRLAAVKAAYDPQNVFHRNVNIPANRSAEQEAARVGANA